MVVRLTRLLLLRYLLRLALKKIKKCGLKDDGKRWRKQGGEIQDGRKYMAEIKNKKNKL